MEDLEITSVESRKRVSLRKKNNLKVDYSYLSKLKIEIGSLIYFRIESENKKVKNVLTR